MKEVRIIGRSSRLSLLQMELTKRRLLEAHPGLHISLLTTESRGDQLQDIPLQTVEGSDFFTQTIIDALENDEADIAVHSLKDMSAAHFFSGNYFAVVDREPVHDLAIFNSNIEEKIRSGKEIVIGTCSPRREKMAVSFLKKALPQTGSFTIITRAIRGNVDTRLRKLDNGEYDGIILAVAGLNRLLSSELDRGAISSVLANKKKMLLPLIECAPAPCQGAIVAEAVSSNKEICSLLDSINLEKEYEDCLQEKKIAATYGSGCFQEFGVTSLASPHGEYRYAAGTDQDGFVFSDWRGLPDLDRINLFSGTDHMRSFFSYEWNSELRDFENELVYIANYKAIRAEDAPVLTGKTLFASGTRTWYELARQGYWVTACADGLGLENFLPLISMPVLSFNPGDLMIITHEEAADRWQEKDGQVISNYRLVPNYPPLLIDSIKNADTVFWASYSQWQHYGAFCKPTATHVCAGGETARRLIEQGLNPTIFPTIKSFTEWNTSGTLPVSVG